LSFRLDPFLQVTKLHLKLVKLLLIRLPLELPAPVLLVFAPGHGPPPRRSQSASIEALTSTSA
jgi:hypothetical protein